MYTLFHHLKGSSFQAQAVDDDGKLSLLTLWEQVWRSMTMQVCVNGDDTSWESGYCRSCT